jgi:hypothetical protein
LEVDEAVLLLLLLETGLLGLELLLKTGLLRLEGLRWLTEAGLLGEELLLLLLGIAILLLGELRLRHLLLRGRLEGRPLRYQGWR